MMLPVVLFTMRHFRTFDRQRVVSRVHTLHGEDHDDRVGGRSLYLVEEVLSCKT